MNITGASTCVRARACVHVLGRVGIPDTERHFWPGALPHVDALRGFFVVWLGAVPRSPQRDVDGNWAWECVPSDEEYLSGYLKPTVMLQPKAGKGLTRRCLCGRLWV